jgi:alkaline phosphatase D
MNQEKSKQTRREFLKTSALAAAGTVVVASEAKAAFLYSNLPKRFSANDVPESDKFGLGVASGDVTAERALLWTYYEGIYPLKAVIWQHGESTPNTPLFWVDAKRGDSGYVHLDVTGLTPGERYQYAFVEVDFAQKPLARSSVGRFRMAPRANDLLPLTIGGVSCTFNLFEPTILEHAGARNDLDFFMLLGDTTYNDGCDDLTQFRENWAHNLSKEGYLSLRKSTSVIATLDDHEIHNNFDPETVEPQLLQDAKQAFFEHQPVRRSNEDSGRIWRKIRWGRTAEIFVLDCRTERLPSTRESASAQYISPKQMQWLKKSLSESDAVFKIIMNSVPIATLPFSSDADRWEGYPAQREELLEFIENARIPGILWVSGDLHFASVGRVAKEGLGSTQNEVLVGPGAQIPNYLCLPLNFNSQYEWASARNNYVVFHFDPNKSEVELVYHAGSDDPRKTRLGDICEIHRTKLKLGKH